MEQYIKKATVVAEIERRIKEILFNHTENALVIKKVYKEILSFINTLEVKDEVVSTDPTSPSSLKISRHGDSHIEAMKEALRMEYEKGRADAIAEMQKEQTKEYLEGVKRVQNYKELTKFEKGFDRIAEIYAHRKNKDGYNKPWYTKERAAEMLYWAKEELGIFNEQ